MELQHSPSCESKEAIADYEAEFGEITERELEATAIAGVRRKADPAASAPERRGAKKKARKPAAKAS